MKHPHGSGPSTGRPNIKMKSFKTQPVVSGDCLWVIFSRKIVHHQHIYLKKHGDIVVYQQNLGTHMTDMEFEKQTSKNNKT